MLLDWTIGNFKSIAEPITLKLAPLTVLVGANSSGKSTILQSILAVMQTLGSPTSERPFILNGEFLKLGTVTDILHQGREGNLLEFGFSLQISREFLSLAFPSLEAAISQTAESDTRTRVGVRCRPITPSTGEAPRLALHSASIELENARISIERNWQARTPDLGARLADGENYGILDLVYPPGGDRPLADKDELRAKVNHFLPESLWEPYDVTAEQLNDALTLCEAFLPRRDLPSWVLTRLGRLSWNSRVGQECRISLGNVIRLRSRSAAESQGYEIGWQLLQNSATAGEWLGKAVVQLNPATRTYIARDLRQERPTALKRLQGDRNYSGERGYRNRQLPEPLEAARRAVIHHFANRVRYLGPLRDDPRAIYELPSVPEDLEVGLRGEYTASVLQNHQSDKVICPLPGDPGFHSEEMTLSKAVTRWLVHMELVDEVMTVDRGKIGTELSLHLSDVGRNLDLTNVGVGVSQVLPSVVMGLLAPSGSTLLMEQPELHLHPKVQSILGDFLIGLVCSGRQCIVETHSEYLINRLRRRIAEAPGANVQKLIQIYFVERVGGRSVFRAVEPNEYGAIPDWPKGFFDQGPDEAQLIIQAATKKRQTKLDAMMSAKKER